MARPSKLANPEFVKLFAADYVEGMSLRELSNKYEIHRDTAFVWSNDPRVRAQAAKLAEDRIQRVTRRVDRELERRLEDADELEVKDLLAIRKEFLGNSFKFTEDKQISADQINDTLTNMEDDEDFDKQVAEFLAKRNGA